MRCRFLSRNPRFATTPNPHFAERRMRLTRFPSSVSSCGSYRLHSTGGRGGHLRLRREEYRGWRTSVTGGETQQLLQTDFPPARHYLGTRGELKNLCFNCQHKLEYYIRSTPLAQSYAHAEDPSAPCQTHIPRDFSSGTEFHSVHGRCSFSPINTVFNSREPTEFFDQTSYLGCSGLRAKFPPL